MTSSQQLSPPDISTPIESLFSLLRDARTVEWLGVAAMACLVYDIMITMGQEIEYIWRSPWRLPKILYLFSRYFALGIAIVNTIESTSRFVTDDRWTLFEGITGQLLVMGVELTLMLRVHAFFRGDKRILALLIAAYIAEVTANTVILGLSLRRIVSVAPLRGLFPPSTPLTGCFPIFVPRYFFSYWIPTLLFESLLFIMMLYIVVQHYRERQIPMKATPLLTLFYRDGTVYYAVIFAILLLNVLLYELVNSALAQAAIAWELTLFSISGSRLILNLRAFAQRTTSAPSSSLSPSPHVLGGGALAGGLGREGSTGLELSMMQFREGTLQCECAVEGITCVCEERLKAERERERERKGANGVSEDSAEWTETWIGEWGQV